MTDLELQSQETEALLKTSERPKKRALAIQIVALCGTAALAGGEQQPRWLAPLSRHAPAARATSWLRVSLAPTSLCAN